MFTFVVIGVRLQLLAVPVQAFVNGNMEFVMVKAGVPGRSADISILNTCALAMNPWRFIVRGFYVLADAGYNMLPWMLVPFTAKGLHVPTADETKFNFALSSTRMVVERAFGVLKSRFRALGHHVVEVWDKQETIKLVLAGCVLHNLCRRFNDLSGLENPVEVFYTDGASVESEREMRACATTVQYSQLHEWANRTLPSYFFDDGQLHSLRDNVWEYTQQQRKLGRERRFGAADSLEASDDSVKVGCKRTRAQFEDSY